MGEEEALNLGINVSSLRKVFIFLATLVVALGIAVCGTIGWIGLVIPHLARIITGPNHGKMIIFSALMGALFLLIIDNLSRILFTAEIPIGILTSLLGAPFFCYIILSKRKSGWA